MVSHSEFVKDSPEAAHVLYRCLYDDRRLCVRPYKMFVETVDRGGKVQPRFAYVGTDEETVRVALTRAGKKAPALPASASGVSSASLTVTDSSVSATITVKEDE